MKVELHRIVDTHPLKMELIKILELQFVPPVGSRYTDDKVNKTYKIEQISFNEEKIIALVCID